jgi:hypothetical protein
MKRNPSRPSLVRWRSPRLPYYSGGGLGTDIYRDALLAARVGAPRVTPATTVPRTTDPWRSLEFRILRPPTEPWSHDRADQLPPTH